MKALIFSDPHFHNYKAHSTIITGAEGLRAGGINSRLSQSLDCFTQAVQLGRAEGCDTMFVTGDVFHVRGNLRPSVVGPVVEAFKWAAMYFNKILVIAGNHDMESLKGGHTAIDILEHVSEGIKVASDGPRVEEVGDGMSVLMVPYCHNPSDFKRFLEAVRSDVVLIHQGIDDFDASGFIPKTGISIEYLKEATPAQVFSGHYHCPKISSCGQVVSPGAPNQQGFGEEGEARGCWVWDPDKAPEFFALNAPEFIVVKSKKDVERAEGNIVRVVGKKPGFVSNLAKLAREAGALSVVMEIEREFTTAHEKSVAFSSDVGKMIADYIDCVAAAKYGSNRECILKLFDEIKAVAIS